MRRIVAVACGLVGIFFAFYFVRLLVVTGGLRHVRPGGGGAFVGAVVFPLIALVFGWLARRLWVRNSQVVGGRDV